MCRGVRHGCCCVLKYLVLITQVPSPAVCVLGPSRAWQLLYMPLYILVFWSDDDEHNVWNLVLGLFCHCRIGLLR